MNIKINSLISKEKPRYFMLTVYPDGCMKLTERALTKRDAHGRYTSTRKPWRGGEITCPVCGTHFYF